MKTAIALDDYPSSQEICDADPDIYRPTAESIRSVLIRYVDALDDGDPDSFSRPHAIQLVMLQVDRVGSLLFKDVFEQIKDEASSSASGRNSNREKSSYVKESIPWSLRKAVFERDAYRCKACDSHIDLCTDHVIPESKGGPATLENLQTLCRRCNSSKHAKTMEEWTR